ncbi:MAG: rod-binding protein [Spirochaetaceae bacterium]|jgi:flagellar protein FlgJ|nr:rod-binding protein [Spirochaetaceae bacterium]
MDITALGSAYLNDSRYSPLIGSKPAPSGTDPGLEPLQSAGEASFVRVLERAARDLKADGEGTSFPAGSSSSPADGGGTGKSGDGTAVPVLSNRRPVVDKTGKLYEQCLALETFLVKTLITGMRNTIQKSELLDGGFAGKMYEDMLYDEYAGDFARNANFGLAELAYLELTDQRGKLMIHP